MEAGVSVTAAEEWGADEERAGDWEGDGEGGDAGCETRGLLAGSGGGGGEGGGSGGGRSGGGRQVKVHLAQTARGGGGGEGGWGSNASAGKPMTLAQLASKWCASNAAIHASLVLVQLNWALMHIVLVGTSSFLPPRHRNSFRALVS